MKRLLKLKNLSLMLIVVIVFSMLTGCGSSSQNQDSKDSDNQQSTGVEGGEKVLIVAATQEPLHFNVNATNAGSNYAAINIFSSLFKSSVTGELIPDLCKEYSISDDGLTYTFKLHENVKWHDGTKFTSEDVKHTIENIKENKGSNVERLACISEIECPDENTLVFKLSERSAGLLALLPQISILPKHLYEGRDWLDNTANQNPVGTGPFKFVEHKKGTNVTIAAFDDYFLGRPKVDKIVYKTIPDENTIVQAYLNNEVDIMDLAGAISPAAMPSIEKQPNTKINTLISADRQYMITNMAKEPWSDLRVRQAIAMTVDRDEMVKKAHKGYAEKAEGFYTPAVSWAYTDEYKLPPMDIEKAKALLDEAGFEPDANGVRIKDVDIVIFQFAVFSDIAKIVKANLSAIGIESKITTLEYAAWEERCKSGDFDIAIIGGYHGPDPDNMIIRVGEGGLLNYGHYKNERLEELFKQGRIANQEDRAPYYHEMQKILSEDLPVIPLTEWCYIVVTRDHITGHYVELPDQAGSGDYYFIDMK